MKQIHEGLPPILPPDGETDGILAPTKTYDQYAFSLRSMIREDNYFSSSDLHTTLKALWVAYKEHYGVRRASGEPFIEHSWKTFNNLWKAGIRNNDILSAALLHDVYEDSDQLRYKPENPEGTTYIQWATKTWKKISDEFNPAVASLAITMTRPVPDGKWPKDKEQADKIYEDGLARGPVGGVLIKMADRLHNLRTLSGFIKKYGKVDGERRIRNAVLETRDKYLNIFKRDFAKTDFDNLDQRDRKAFERARDVLYDQIIDELRKYSVFSEIPPEA